MSQNAGEILRSAARHDDLDRKECNYIISISYMVLYLTFIFSTVDNHKDEK